MKIFQQKLTAWVLILALTSGIAINPVLHECHACGEIELNSGVSHVFHAEEASCCKDSAPIQNNHCDSSGEDNTCNSCSYEPLDAAETILNSLRYLDIHFIHISKTIQIPKPFQVQEVSSNYQFTPLLSRSLQLLAKICVFII